VDRAIVRFNGRDDGRVRGASLEVTDEELAQADRHEPGGHARIAAKLASGAEAFVSADARGIAQEEATG
jgi:hypothetical protein